MVNLVVSCSNRKTAAPSERLRLGSIRIGSVEHRAAEWIDRLESDPSETRPALQLYCGDHWSIASSLSKDGITTLVASAGYGLVPIDAPLKPYGATFDSRHEDRVVVRADSEPAQDTAWWSALARWPGPCAGAPRTLAEIARRDPSSPLMVVASPPYLRAMKNDLQEAAANLKDPDLLSLFCAGTASLDDLDGHHVPCDARLQARVGGARQSLNARAARLALQNLPFDSLRASVMRKRIGEIASEQPEVPDLERTPATDEEVREFLRAALRENEKAKHSPLLRVFRDSGRACEQSRFATLFKEVYAELHGKAEG